VGDLIHAPGVFAMGASFQPLSNERESSSVCIHAEKDCVEVATTNSIPDRFGGKAQYFFTALAFAATRF
jgi:hypothetical protein